MSHQIRRGEESQHSLLFPPSIKASRATKQLLFLLPWPWTGTCTTPVGTSWAGGGSLATHARTGPCRSSYQDGAGTLGGTCCGFTKSSSCCIFQPFCQPSRLLALAMRLDGIKQLAQFLRLGFVILGRTHSPSQTWHVSMPSARFGPCL